MTKTNRPRALITGITGQDGAYLAALLLNKGYEVHGVRRRTSTDNSWRIAYALSTVPNERHYNLKLHYGDMTDALCLTRLVCTVQPDEIYNLAAQSHVAVSFESPEYTAQADALGTLRLLEAIRLSGLSKQVRFYQASTSELFGNAPAPQNEKTPFTPCSPYAAAKLYAYWITMQYRESYGMFACNGILFNHESPLRDPLFVTRKITSTLARIAHGQQHEPLLLGNLDAQRDWGYAPEYVEAMWLILQQEQPDNYVIATGETHSVRSFAEHACAEIGIQLTWHKKDIFEQGVDINTGKVIVAVDPSLFRPTDVNILIGDALKAQEKLSWQPKVDFKTLVSIMMRHDMAHTSSSISSYKQPLSFYWQEAL